SPKAANPHEIAKLSKPDQQVPPAVDRELQEPVQEPIAQAPISPVAALRIGMSPEEVQNLMPLEGKKKITMKGRDGVTRSTFEWFVRDGEMIEAKFEEDRLYEWESIRIPTQQEVS